MTEADRLASRVIVEGLRREFPNDMVVSEEESIPPWPRFLIVSST